MLHCLLPFLQINMSSKNNTRLCELNEESVNQLLFRDNSDTEDALPLDDEDIGFLEDDLNQMDLNSNNDDDRVEVYIEPQKDEQESTSARD